VRYIRHWKLLWVEKLERDCKVYQLIAQNQMLPNVAKFYTMVQCCFASEKYRGHFNLGPKKQRPSHMEHSKPRCENDNEWQQTTVKQCITLKKDNLKDKIAPINKCCKICFRVVNVFGGL